MAPSFDVPGWFATGPGVFRNVGTVLLDSFSAPAKIERMVVLDDAFMQSDPAVATLLRAALKVMADDLPNPRHANISLQGFDVWREAFRMIQGCEVWKTFGSFIQAHDPKMGRGIRERIEFSSKISEDEANAARLIMAQARNHIRSIVQQGTILTLPTAPSIAPLAKASESDIDSFRTRVMRLTCIARMSGLPQVTSPLARFHLAPSGSPLSVGKVAMKPCLTFH